MISLKVFGSLGLRLYLHCDCCCCGLLLWAVVVQPTPHYRIRVLYFGTQVHNHGFVSSHASQLQHWFLDHSMDRLHFLSRIKVWTQSAPADLGLLGRYGVAVGSASFVCVGRGGGGSSVVA